MKQGSGGSLPTAHDRWQASVWPKQQWLKILRLPLILEGTPSAPGPAQFRAHTTRPLSTAAKPVTTSRPVPAVADESGHKRVRRGRLEIDATLDLHGMTRQAAHVELARFLASMRSRGFKCVLVITGKGLVVDPEDYINPQPGVIRRRLPEWLNGHDIRPHVSGYASANARHGGSGAYYVMLKR
jgi:DNA-nicking Smr family endonuclease